MSAFVSLTVRQDCVHALCVAIDDDRQMQQQIDFFERKAAPNFAVGTIEDNRLFSQACCPAQVEITASLLKAAIQKDAKRYDMFLVDGFPRNIANLKGWERICGKSVVVEKMLMFECSEKIMTKRLLNRGKTSGRVDDNMDTIRKRLMTYIQETMPVMNQFEKMGKLTKIDCDREVPQVKIDTFAHKRMLAQTHVHAHTNLMACPFECDRVRAHKSACPQCDHARTHFNATNEYQDGRCGMGED